MLVSWMDMHRFVRRGRFLIVGMLSLCHVVKSNDSRLRFDAQRNIAERSGSGRLGRRFKYAVRGGGIVAWVELHWCGERVLPRWV
jgi:hypothetical protein